MSEQALVIGKDDTNNNNNKDNKDKDGATPGDSKKNVIGEKQDRTVHRMKASTCSIQSVTVYNDGAEITRNIVVDIKEEGTHEVVMYDLSPNIDPDSIRVFGGVGKATIVEVSNQEVFGDREDLDETAKLFKKIEGIRLDRTKITQNQAACKQERTWLDNFAVGVRSGGAQATNAPLSFGDLKVDDFTSNASAFLKFYADQIGKFDDRETAYTEALKDLATQENVIKKQISQLQQQHLLAFSREVSVVLSANSPSKVHLQVSYLIKNAHWTASYDARMSSENEDTLELTYFGSITNASGEDWNNVQLHLSTASPSFGGAPPPLRFLRIQVGGYGQANNVIQPNSRARSYSKAKSIDYRAQKAIDQISSNVDANLHIDAYMEQTEGLWNQAREYHKESLQQDRANRRGFTSKVQSDSSVGVMTAYSEASHVGASNATFDIPNGSTIVSDNKPHKVTIAVLPLKARLSHYATPDASGHVYLKATATNSTENYPFLAGPMNVFMNSNFVSKSELSDVSPQEKFSVFLGVDAGVKLEVKPVRRIKEKQSGIINKTNTESFRHTSIVKNNRKNKINISVLCQVPASSDERIKVKVIKPDLKQQDGPVKFMDSKLLKWKLSIASGHHEELSYHYSVEWPANLNIQHMAAN